MDLHELQANRNQEGEVLLALCRKPLNLYNFKHEQKFLLSIISTECDSHDIHALHVVFYFIFSLNLNSDLDTDQLITSSFDFHSLLAAHEIKTAAHSVIILRISRKLLYLYQNILVYNTWLARIATLRWIETKTQKPKPGSQSLFLAGRHSFHL